MANTSNKTGKRRRRRRRGTLGAVRAMAQGGRNQPQSVAVQLPNGQTCTITISA